MMYDMADESICLFLTARTFLTNWAYWGSATTRALTFFISSLNSWSFGMIAGLSDPNRNSMMSCLICGASPSSNHFVRFLT